MDPNTLHAPIRARVALVCGPMLAVLVETSSNPTLSEATLAMRASHACTANVTRVEVLAAIKACEVPIRNGRISRAALSTVYFHLADKAHERPLPAHDPEATT